MGKRAPAIGFIFITLLIDVIGFGIIIPVMPTLIQSMTGGTVSEAAQTGGWLLAAYAITQFLCAPIVGGLSDRFGRRPVLLAASLRPVCVILYRHPLLVAAGLRWRRVLSPRAVAQFMRFTCGAPAPSRTQ